MKLLTQFFIWDQHLSKRPLFWEWILLGFISAIFFWIKFEGAVISAPDSPTYISFNLIRTPGYPSFLFLVHSLTGGYETIPFIQLLLYYTGTLWLSITLARFFKTYFGGLIFLGLFIFNIELIRNCFYILTESLSTTLVLFMSIFLINFINTKKILFLFLISLFIGISISIRPSSYSYVALFLPFLVLYFSWFIKNTLKKLLSLLVPLGVVLLSSCTIQYFKNGFFGSESFLGNNLIGKILLVARENSPSSHPKIMKEIDEFAAPIRGMLKTTNCLHFKYLLIAPHYYDYLRFSEMDRLKKSLHYEHPLTDKVLREVALDAIKAQPLLYAQDVLINFYALWFLWDLKTYQENLEFKNMLSRLSPLPYIKELPIRARTYIYAQGLVCKVIGFLRLILGFGFLSSLVAIIMSFGKALKNKEIPDTLQFSCFMGIWVHAYFLLVALLQAGLARYALTIWPALFAGMIAFIIWGRDIYLKKEKQKESS